MVHHSTGCATADAISTFIFVYSWSSEKQTVFTH